MNVTSRQFHNLRILPTEDPADPQIVDGTRCEGVEGVTRRTWHFYFETIGWSLFTGVMFVIALVFVSLAFDLLDGNLASVVSGQVALWQHVEFRSAVIVALLAGVLMADFYEEAATQCELARLKSHFPDIDSEQFEDQMETVDPSRLRRVGLLGALVATAIGPTLYTEPARFLRLETFTLPSVLFDLAMGAALGWIAARMLYRSVGQNRC